MHDEAKSREQLLAELFELRERVSHFEKEHVERKKAEEAVKAERRRLFNVLEALPAMVSLLTPDYHIAFANRAIRERFGESQGRHCYDYCFGRSEPCDFCEAYKVLETGLPHNWEVTAPDGSVIDAYDFPFTDVNGSPLILEMGIDITERKRMEEELRNNQSLLSTLIESTPFELWAVGNDGRYILANSICQNRYGKIVGMTPEELCAENPETLSIWQENNRRALAGDLVKYDVKFTFGQEESTYHNIIGPIRDGDQIKGILGVNIDITQRKQMEDELIRARAELEFRVQERTAQLEKANEQLRRIPARLIAAQEEERKRLAVELHDSIGQTLAALKFRIEHMLLISQKEKAEETVRLAEEFIPIIQRSIEETRAIYMGLRPKILEDFGAIAALMWYRNEMINLYPQRHIEMDIRIEESEIPTNLVVPIFRIAQETLNNVCKHSKAEWVDFRLALNHGAIELEICDDGIGMDLDYIMKSRLANSLGLIGMRERAELTGGELTIKSALGKGTTVRSCWPIWQSAKSSRSPLSM